MECVKWPERFNRNRGPRQDRIDRLRERRPLRKRVRLRSRTQGVKMSPLYPLRRELKSPGLPGCPIYPGERRPERLLPPRRPQQGKALPPSPGLKVRNPRPKRFRLLPSALISEIIMPGPGRNSTAKKPRWVPGGRSMVTPGTNSRKKRKRLERSGRRRIHPNRCRRGGVSLSGPEL